LSKAKSLTFNIFFKVKFFDLHNMIINKESIVFKYTQGEAMFLIYIQNYKFLN
jgi:hypothetical protein